MSKNGTPALVAQLDMKEWAKGYGQGWADWFWGTYSGQQKIGKAGESHAKKGMVAALKAVSKGATVFVSADMCALIEKAAEEMPDIPLQQENLFWEDAFIYFERPISLAYEHEYDESPVATKAIYFQHTTEILQAETADLDKPVAKPGVLHFTFIDYKDTDMTFDEIGTRLFPYDLSAWTYGKPWKTVAIGKSEWGTKVDENVSHQRKILLAINLIAAQYIAHVTPAQTERSQRRRAERMGEVSTVTFVTLRRSREHETSEGGISDFEYSHRFIVSGHWRHQWYSSRGEHHLIWINPHVKGPDDKPLVIKDKVWQVVQ